MRPENLKTGNSDVQESPDGTLERSARLKIAVRAAGGNSAVSAKSGVPFGTLNNYLAGREMKAGAMIALARACNVSLDWLAEGQDRADNSFEVAKAVPSEDMMTVKYFHVEPTAGRGAVPSDFEGYESINLSREFLKNVLGIYSNEIFFLRVQGDSMQPSINPGETLLVDFKPDSLTQSIYVISVQGLLMVKRLSIKDPQTFKVVSDNPRYDAFDVPINRVCWGNADVDNADMRIIGRVVGRFQLGI